MNDSGKLHCYRPVLSGTIYWKDKYIRRPTKWRLTRENMRKTDFHKKYFISFLSIPFDMASECFSGLMYLLGLMESHTHVLGSSKYQNISDVIANILIFFYVEKYIKGNQSIGFMSNMLN